MGDLDVETFPLLVLAVLERAEDKLELILIVVIPLKTMDVGAKEEQYDLFCMKTVKSGLVQVVSEFSVGMHMHEDNSSPLTMRPSPRHDYPELEIHTMGVYD